MCVSSATASIVHVAPWAPTADLQRTWCAADPATPPRRARLTRSRGAQLSRSVRALRAVPRAARAPATRRFCSTVAEEAEEVVSDYSFKNPAFGYLAAAIGVGYIGAARWVHEDTVLAEAIAELKGPEPAATPAAETVELPPPPHHRAEPPRARVLSKGRLGWALWQACLCQKFGHHVLHARRL